MGDRKEPTPVPNDQVRPEPPPPPPPARGTDLNPNVMLQPFVVAFTEWDRRYRADPKAFWNQVEYLLGHTPETYGEAAAAYFVWLLDYLSNGQPWMTIQNLPEAADLKKED